MYHVVNEALSDIPLRRLEEELAAYWLGWVIRGPHGALYVCRVADANLLFLPLRRTKLGL